MKDLGPGPPAVMPVIDYIDEQKQFPNTMEQNPGTSIDCNNIGKFFASFKYKKSETFTYQIQD